MSAKWKGTLQIVLVSDEPFYDPSSGLQYTDRIWAGKEEAIKGFANDLEEEGIGYQISASPPIFMISARIPISDATIDIPDRYEISTEAQDKSIFELPGVVEEIIRYDASIAETAETYKSRAERFVDKGLTYVFDDINFPLFGKVVRHLRNGVTGFQTDYVVLRRMRQIDLSYGYSGGRMNLSDGLLIFTTAQLNLPSEVGFVVPSTPTDPSADYAWGWKVRGQRVELVGNYMEQVVELVFAPWSTLAYELSSSNLSW